MKLKVLSAAGAFILLAACDSTAGDQAEAIEYSTEVQAEAPQIQEFATSEEAADAGFDGNVEAVDQIDDSGADIAEQADGGEE